MRVIDDLTQIEADALSVIADVYANQALVIVQPEPAAASHDVR